MDQNLSNQNISKKEMLDELIKKPVQVLSCDFFYGNHKIMGIDSLKLVFVQEVFESPEKRFVSQDKSEHM